MPELKPHPAHGQPAAQLSAAGQWTKITVNPKSLPQQDRSVLLRLELVGPVYDVAVYRGRDAKGDHRWIHADIELTHKIVTHWTYFNEPEDAED